MIIFFKMQALGNDFIVIDCMKETPKYNLSILSKFLCDRHFSVGGDGVIYFYKSKVADIRMRIFNSDGSEAEMCGNGIRCLAKFLYDKEIIRENEFKIETIAGIKNIKLHLMNNKVDKIEVNMGKVSFDLNSVPVYLPKINIKDEIPDIEINHKDRLYKFNSVSVGNPHSVCFVNNFDDFNFQEIGKLVENYKYFPKKTNVEFVIVENKSKIKVRVWERGVGRTLGCGTGAIASAVVAMKKLYTESDLIVELEGGSVEVKNIDGDMYLIGGAEFLYTGEISNL